MPRDVNPSFEDVEIGELFSSNIAPGKTFKKKSDSFGECIEDESLSQLFHPVADVRFVKTPSDPKVAAATADAGQDTKTKSRANPS